ncbi:TlpA family protein disulfide reductase [Tenacibaculum xiamenense]|uniref:TlpA family protein disulfide reductase n=1 Tax=Tenacibaculum xiamenense TaxID=1261553 RepID=UPI0038952C10
MKKIVLLALIGGIMLSCKKEAPVKDYLILSGTVDNFKKRDVKLEGFDFEKKIPFNKKTKTFVDTLRIERDGYYKLTVNKRKFDVYLTKTDDLKILLDYKNPDAIKFEGVNGVTGDYFIKKKNLFAEQIINLRELLGKEEPEFLSTLDTYKNALTDLAINSKLPEAFLKKEIKNIEYEYLRDLYFYPTYYPALSGNEDFVPSENFPSVTDKINFNEGEDYKDFDFYQKIVQDEIQRLADERATEDADVALNYLETVQTEVTDSIVKNDLLFEKGQKGITYTEDLEGYYNKYIAFSTNKAHKDRITEIYNSLKLTAKGMPCPKFENYENIAGGTTSLDELLNSGKYLYIDVWATWCSFCKRETPLLKRLELQYHDQNIEFVSISVDNINAKDKWKETIEQKEMGGVQLFADKSFGSDFIKKFAIKGLPRFIMVDPEGNIISPNAPRPSDGEKLMNMFEELGISI